MLNQSQLQASRAEFSPLAGQFQQQHLQPVALQGVRCQSGTAAISRLPPLWLPGPVFHPGRQRHVGRIGRRLNPAQPGQGVRQPVKCGKSQRQALQRGTVDSRGQLIVAGSFSLFIY